MSKRSWEPIPYDSGLADQLQTELGLSRLTAVLLAQRGISTPKEAQSFLAKDLSELHDPALLPDYEKIAPMLIEATRAKKKIYVHGDYDVDGITATAILTRFLSKLGAEVMHHIPHREAEGYGIHADSVNRAKEFGADIFLTCDCGITAFEQVAALKALGMTVIVTDHHEPASELPKADAIMNPHLPDSKYPYPNLSGAGVAYKLCLGLVRDLGLPEDRYHNWYLEYAAMGTIADVMPLTGENRLIAAHGLKAIKNSTRPGTSQLIRVCQLDSSRSIRAIDVGFRIGPRLNAAGRVDHAKHALDLLLTNDISEAYRLANDLDKLNVDRKNRQGRILDEALELIAEKNLQERFTIVVGSSQWESGLIGIVAGRIKDRFNRPAFVLSIGEKGYSKCSARSIPEYPLHELIDRLKPMGVLGGGHAVAAGFAVPSDILQDLKDAIEADASARLTQELLVPKHSYVSEVALDDLSIDTLREYEQLEPFGTGNPEPVLLLRSACIKELNPTRTGEHWRLTLSQPGSNSSLSTMFFNPPLSKPEWRAGASFDLLVRPEIDRYQGRESPKAIVHDWQSASA